MSLDIFYTFAANPELEVGGVWRSIGGGARLKVARVGNEAYNRFVRKEYKANDEVLNGPDDELSTKTSDDILQTAAANHILLDWEGLSYKGESRSYSVESAKEFLAHKDFYAQVLALAGQAEEYRYKADAEVAKN